MTTPRKTRWMDMLRRRRSGGTDASGRPALDDAAIWKAHESASEKTQEAAELAEQVTATLTRQRALIDTVSERAGVIGARAEGLAATARRVTESLDRLGVVALNAGLEGARVPEPQGRSLLLISDEIKANAVRGSEAAHELALTVEELATSATEARQQVDSLRNDLAAVTQEAARMKSTADAANGFLHELHTRLKKATGVDPEIARSVSRAAEHARGLTDSLSRLPSTHASVVLRALAPSVAPLVRLISEMAPELLAEVGDDDSDPSKE